MLPKLLEIPIPGLGALPIHTYGLMIAIGFLVVLTLVRREAKALGIEPDHISNMAFWCLLLGILGTRVLHIAMYPDQYSWKDPIGWIALWRGGLVFQGGIPAALVFAVLYTRKHGISFWTVSDLAFTYIPLAHGMGRLGCLGYGCCFGKTTDLPWAIRFPNGSPAFNDHIQRTSELTMSDTLSLPVHPTQLYAALALWAFCGLLYLLRRTWNPFPGFVMPIYFIIYGFLRVGLEMVRGDHNPTHFGGAVTDQQVFAAVTALLGVVLFFILRHFNRPHPERPAPSAST
jgi:phosphatidylglycerol---prolipoprotein diacylglyceryl transferase